jgi:hypothetical protein
MRGANFSVAAHRYPCRRDSRQGWHVAVDVTFSAGLSATGPQGCARNLGGERFSQSEAVELGNDDRTELIGHDIECTKRLARLGHSHAGTGKEVF